MVMLTHLTNAIDAHIESATPTLGTVHHLGRMPIIKLLSLGQTVQLTFVLTYKISYKGFVTLSFYFIFSIFNITILFSVCNK